MKTVSVDSKVASLPLSGARAPAALAAPATTQRTPAPAASTNVVSTFAPSTTAARAGKLPAAGPGENPVIQTKAALAATAKGKEELASVHQLVDDAAKLKGLPASAVERMKKPSEVHQGTLDVALSDGSKAQFPFFRVRFGRPAKGGIRFLESVTREQVEALALEMDVKIRISGLPLRGGKGGVGTGKVLQGGREHGAGVELAPEKLSMQDKKAIITAYREAFGPNGFGPDVDVPAPDMNTGPEIMEAFLEADEKLKGYREPATVTGKPVIQSEQGVVAGGGNLLRSISTGLGMVFQAERAAERVGLKLQGATATVQGAGEVGMAAAMGMHERGTKVTHMSDAFGAIHAPEGLDVPAVKAFLAETGSLVGFPGARAIDPKSVLTAKADFVMPAAVSGQVHEGNAQSIIDSGTTSGKTKIVVEGANGASTYAGGKALGEAGIFVVPDVLGNIGGVVVSYFEGLQNTEGQAWSYEKTFDRLKDVCDGAFDRAVATSEKLGISVRQGAIVNAVGEIAELNLRTY